MSVIVKSMEMPKNCKACVCSNYYDRMDMFMCDITNEQIDEKQWKRERHPNCPLIELSPHGRLIDATFEENHYASMLLNPTPDVTEQDKHKARIIIEALRMAGTVIEAEGVTE